MHREKFTVTRAASRAKRIVCNGNSTMQFLKPLAHRAYRHAINQALKTGRYDHIGPVPPKGYRVTSWDIC